MRPDKYGKLTEAAMREIVKLDKEDYNKSEISEITGIPRKTVSDFLNRKGNKNKIWWDIYDEAMSNVTGVHETHEQFIKRLAEFDASKQDKTKLVSIFDNDFAERVNRCMKDNKTEPLICVKEKDDDIHTDDIGLKIFVVPDTQIKPESDIRHIIAAGNYIAAHKPDVVVVIGDWYDMSSLNRYGTRLDLDGKRIIDDINAGNEAMLQFLDCFYDQDGYKPRLVFTVGNHDPQVRIPRLVSEYPQLEGMLVDNTSDWLRSLGFEVYEYLDIVNINGIRFSHYFQNPHSAKKAPLSGQIDGMIKNAGFSFVQGHTQVYKHGKHYLGDGSTRIGLVCGSFSQDKEHYMGAQGAHTWNGVILLNEVKNGGADICEISLNYLLREWY